MSTTGERFIDGYEKAIKYYRATHMRGIIHQIKTMINSTVPYSVYACVNDPKQLTILSRVIALLNEKNLSQEITMTVKPERGGYFIEVHPIQFSEW
ncbi:hypothetical protein [uncultured Veillonella sp.]|uniref:hypothetical protein n=1 Tax=uncultured Veillonella sp. TaxID=159268 RepID=UPI0025DC94F1|nr:hypothetical protein [uncultured Veillonella sp.]